ncbi:hypothetical protein H0R92_00730 [Treponema sp. OMZ 840]|uniref:pesticin C-terminus-like muramidase n=1 Tax=Treponema sp. OMZ 840 TaxID=244313 RepID=UPI003D939AB7
MEAGRRVFSDATQNSPSGCKKLGKHGSRKRAVRRSAHLITDYKGDEYERVEYTPYGEYWIEKRASENRTLPFKFTGKERDEETGLYYYGARYLDAKTSRWLTTDPALSDYVNAKESNSTSGGIYNSINFNLYHYANNNPIKYLDPDGREVDYKFIAKHEGKQQLNGYVPTNKDGSAIGRSGVTIATGFDIGQHNSYDLNRIFGRSDTNKDLKELYTPYLDKRKQDAIDKLAEIPLSVTQEQANRTDAAVFSQKLKSIKDAFNGASKNKDVNFDNLPDNAQTALFSFAYQNGSGAIPQDLVDKLVSGDYSGAADILTQYGKDHGYANRRNAEAGLLRQLPNQNTSTAN